MGGSSDMSTLVAGRVAITPEGDWLNSLPYKRLSLVKYNDHLYVSKKDSPAGTLPTNATYWMDCGNMDISVATVYVAGKVKPDGETITIDEDGTIHSIATGSANLIEISEEDYYNTLTPEEQEDPDVAYFVYDGEVPDVIVVDGAMSDISSNPVQNRVIKKYIDEHSSQVEELTQAEYDALPDSKNSDGTLRVIKDVPIPNAVATADKVKYGNGNVKIALDEINSDLSDYDLSKTSLPSGTTFKEFIQMLLEKNFPHWTTEGLSIVDNRVTILDGGYAINGNTCTWNMRIRFNTSIASTGQTIINNCPVPLTGTSISSDTSYGLYVSTTGAMQCTGIPSGTVMTISGQYTLA